MNQTMNQQKLMKTWGNAAEIFVILFVGHVQKHKFQTKNTDFRGNCTFSCFQKVWNFPLL